jgi:hypothetical protein
MLLHESNILPALYVPTADVRFDLLTKTELSTHCPFKGDASYWTITVGESTLTDRRVADRLRPPRRGPTDTRPFGLLTALSPDPSCRACDPTPGCAPVGG